MIEEGQKRKTFRQRQAQAQITKIQEAADRKFEADMRRIYFQNLFTDVSVENAYDERPVSPPLADEHSREVTMAPSDALMNNVGSGDDSEYMLEEMPSVSEYTVDPGTQRRGRGRGVEVTPEDRHAAREFARRFYPHNPQLRDWEEFSRTVSAIQPIGFPTI